MLCGNSQQGLKIQQKSACLQEKYENNAKHKISTSLKNASKMGDVNFSWVGILGLIFAQISC